MYNTYLSFIIPLFIGHILLPKETGQKGTNKNKIATADISSSTGQ